MKTSMVALLFLLSAVAAAQSSSGYVFIAPGGSTCCGRTNMTMHLGGGMDAVLWKGLAASLELGALGPREGYGDYVLGVFSPGAAYYLRRGENTWDPFVAGGYSLFFRNGVESLGYLGAGTNYWFARKVGLRMEFRDHVHGGYSAVNFWGFRFGVAFR